MHENLFAQGLVAQGEEILEFLSGQLGEPIFTSADDAAGDLALGYDDLVDFFLDGTDADKLMNLNVLVLADAKGTVGCLVFDSGVPPPVKMEDMVGGGQVQTCAVGFDGEARALAAGRLKPLDHAVALGFGHLAFKP
jgi:hypothetical protein